MPTTFATTSWTLVVAAQGASRSRRAALEELCGKYWFPVHALIRERGFGEDAARDLTQEFFAGLLAREGLALARREKGRFRTFLATSVRNFLNDQWDKSRAQKRGGGTPILSLSDDTEGHRVDAAHDETPDKHFDKRWAEELVKTARNRLRAELESEGRQAWWEVLERVGDPGAAPLSAEAIRLGIPLNTLKSHLRRARQRQAMILRSLVAETVTTPTEVDDELRYLLAVLSD